MIHTHRKKCQKPRIYTLLVIILPYFNTDVITIYILMMMIAALHKKRYGIYRMHAYTDPTPRCNPSVFLDCNVILSFLLEICEGCKTQALNEVKTFLDCHY